LDYSASQCPTATTHLTSASCGLHSPHIKTVVNPTVSCLFWSFLSILYTHSFLFSYCVFWRPSVAKPEASQWVRPDIITGLIHKTSYEFSQDLPEFFLSQQVRISS